MKPIERDPFDKADFGLMTNDHMSCPSCRTNLAQFDILPLETLDEHISLPLMEDDATIPLKPAYRCPQEHCVTRQMGMFWNFLGELYIENGFKILPSEVKNKLIPEGNDAPYGSLQRQSNIEIYKKDENRVLIVLPLWFPNVLSGMTIRTKWSYKADYNGKILKRRLGFEYITKTGIVHLWGLRMVKFGVKRCFKVWLELRRDPNDQWALGQLNEFAHPKFIVGNEWWRAVNQKVAQLLLKFVPKPLDTKAVIS